MSELLDLKQVLDEGDQKTILDMLRAHETVMVKKAEWLDAENELKRAKKNFSYLAAQNDRIIPELFIASSFNQVYLITIDFDGDGHQITMLSAELR